MITPVVNHIYAIKHGGKVITAQCLDVRKIEGFKYRKTCSRYHFRNLHTLREIVLKSRAKILSEVI